MNQQQKIPERWNSKKLKDVVVFNNGKGHERNIVDNGKYVVVNSKYISSNQKVVKYSDLQLSPLFVNDVVMVMSDVPNGKAIAKCFLVDKDNTYTLNQRIGSFNSKEITSQFLFYILNRNRYFLSFDDGVNQTNLRKEDILDCHLTFPNISEQNRIVEVLETWDKYLERLDQKIEIKKNIKKGLMQNLLTGNIRLNGFSKDWETVELGQTLKYEQPWKCIVETDNYDNNYKTPVLTANKSFILGYTNETDGIYEDLPVIIFDDFTTLNKYVDFPFKVKSSAIKILKPKNKNFNLKFLFERIQLIPYVVGEHKRCYISEYQFIDIKIPETEEQNAIADILIKADKEIEILEKQRKIVKNQKKYLLNNLITGQIRLPEFINKNQNYDGKN